MDKNCKIFIVFLISFSLSSLITQISSSLLLKKRSLPLSFSLNLSSFLLLLLMLLLSSSQPHNAANLPLAMGFFFFFFFRSCDLMCGFGSGWVHMVMASGSVVGGLAIRLWMGSNGQIQWWVVQPMGFDGWLNSGWVGLSCLGVFLFFVFSKRDGIF